MGQKCVHDFELRVCYFCPTQAKIGTCQKIVVKFSNLAYYWNLFACSRQILQHFIANVTKIDACASLAPTMISVFVRRTNVAILDRLQNYRHPKLVKLHSSERGDYVLHKESEKSSRRRLQSLESYRLLPNLT